MVNSMLEQAIIDANALREAAIKSAEKAIVEKYSNQIKQTVDQLLEQDDLGLPEEELPLSDMAAPEADLGGLDTSLEAEGGDLEYGEEIGDESPTASDADVQTGLERSLSDEGGGYAFADGSSLSDLGEDEEIEINLEQIIREMKENVKNVLGDKESDETDEKEDELTEEMVSDELDAGDEELNIPDEDLEEMAESLKYDDTGEGHLTGWMGMPDRMRADALETQAVIDELAEYNEKAQEKNSELKKENKELSKKIGSILEENKKLNSEIKKLTDVINQVKQKFNESQLLSTKLLYTNKALMDTSLNERQKQEIVESINKVNSVDQAKIIYETLQSTVGNSLKSKKPESLSEVVSRHSSTSILLKSRENQDEKRKDNSYSDRMKVLAGIK